MKIFLSTLSLRRATPSTAPATPQMQDFYPRSPCGERLLVNGNTYKVTDFYPRSPCGERRRGHDDGEIGGAISIHALLAESDHNQGVDQLRLLHFYPRSPCGERHGP